MDPLRFDDLTRRVGMTATRRRLLLGQLAGSTLGLVIAQPSFVAAKKRKHKHKHKRKAKKARPNAFGCLSVGADCKSAEHCCSSICEGKKCRAHGNGTCDQQAADFCTAAEPLRTTCDNSGTCFCLRTTAGSTFCGDNHALLCIDCATDRDCVAAGFSAAAACIVVSEQVCAGVCPSGTACAEPCGAPPPEE